VNARSLQEDLLSIPGVEGAEIEGSADKPAGLRIRIAEGADQRAVGGAIRRVLTAHGLGTDTRLPGESTAESDVSPVAPAPAASDESVRQSGATSSSPSDSVASGGPTAVAVVDDDEAAAVIDLTGEADPMHEVEETLVPANDATDAPTEPASPTSEVGTAESEEPSLLPQASPSRVGQPSALDRRADPDPDAQPSGAGGSFVVSRLASVAVEEGRDGITVTVTASDGSALRQAAGSSEGGVEAAVVRATAKLAMPSAPDAAVIEIEDRRVEGVDIVMIVLDVDGRKAAGSAVVGAGRAFALARATWSALSM
jgi:hypothetical protein